MQKHNLYTKDQIIVLGVLDRQLKEATSDGMYDVCDYPEIYYYINQFEHDPKHLSKWKNAGFTPAQIQEIKNELMPFVAHK